MWLISAPFCSYLPEAGMQDTGSGLRAVDKIAQRLNLRGVYGPLYRLCEIPDPKYNTAVELTAGNR
jgi:structural maintenance of chromosome 3 (chondroitin sulfate proteoglycan 6)